MTRLRFIKPWSTYRPGDTMETNSPHTVDRLVRTYGLAEVVSDKGAVVESAQVVETRAFTEPAENKMIAEPKKTKTRKRGHFEPQKATPAHDTGD